MPTPTSVLEDFITAFELLYSAPTFAAVDDGAETGDKFTTATLELGATDVTIGVNYRVNGTSTETNNFTLTVSSLPLSPSPSTPLLRSLLNEDATGQDILDELTPTIDLLIDLGAAFTAV